MDVDDTLMKQHKDSYAVITFKCHFVSQKVDVEISVFRKNEGFAND